MCDGFMHKKPKAAVAAEVKRSIKRAAQEVKIPVLRYAAISSLLSFFEEQWRTAERTLAHKRMILLCLLSLSGERATVEDRGKARPIPKTEAARVLAQSGFDVTGFSHVSTAKVYGVPVQKYSEDYFAEQVAPAFKRLLQQFPKDPDDISGRNSLRNRAEMEVRYNGHLDQIDELITAGHKLVVASVHADCSTRCKHWQGRVYSLDGTYGKTDDGREYIAG